MAVAALLISRARFLLKTELELSSGGANSVGHAAHLLKKKAITLKVTMSLT